MKKNSEVLRLLQIAGGNFPVGAFSQSLGLENYVAKKITDNIVKLKELLQTYIMNTLGKNELPVLIEAFRLCECSDLQGILYLNDLSLATRTTRESRDASSKSGKAMLRIIRELIDDELMDSFYSQTKNGGIAYNVAFAITTHRMDIDLQNAVSAFVFSSVNSLVQAAVKLMPLGNVAGQQILGELIPAMEAAADDAFRIPVEEISNFTPAIDMASIEHETLSTRLYMS